ncbi:MAG TPA: 4-hydroxythreonine-4-phosphate dehydrogenase PdxA [Sphingomonadaceae bacterium]
MNALAASLGDPAGIGPELLCEAWARRREERLPPFFAVGGENLLAAAARMRGLDVPVRRIAAPGEAAHVFSDALPVIGGDDADYAPGSPARTGAQLALGSLQKATALAVAGEAAGVVTCPVSKALLAEVGFAFPGQTEFLAYACGIAEQDAVMMLAGPSLHTVPLTVHVALARVPALLTAALIVSRSRIVAAALKRDFGLERPRLAIAALNPHAGEKGAFGHEERDVIAPAIARLVAEGIDVSGPHPADALFAERARETYDAAICMYHDQALIPLKTLDFDRGVNMTLGLPIVRTSPDHGTAFAIAGQRIASAGATIAAIRMAGEAAARRARA